MIKIEKATVKITEQTIRKLVRIIEEVKSRTKFTNVERARLQKEKGIVIIASDYSDTSFEVHIEKKPRTPESIHLLRSARGYKLLK